MNIIRSKRKVTCNLEAKKTKKVNVAEAQDQKRWPSKLPEQMDVHYLKTSSYRTYYMDGIFGGVTPNAKLYVELFLQRSPTPQTIQYSVEKDGNLGKELRRVGKEGLIREIEAGLVMDIQTAKVFRGWLDDKIKEFEKMTSSLSGEKEDRNK